MVTIRNRLHRCWQATALRRTTVLETMNAVARAIPASKRVSVDPKVECPLRDVPLTAGDRQ